jgi:hypothetical protein
MLWQGVTTINDTINVLFDGTVFRPIEPVGLQPNTKFVVTIVSPGTSELEQKEYVVASDEFASSLGEYTRHNCRPISN